MSHLRGVVIGAGYFSQFHFEAWSRIEKVDLVGVCDFDLERAGEAVRKYDAGRAYRDVATMFQQEQPDFVDIVTRPDTHLELVSLAAEHGIPTICQKPLAPTFETSREISRVAKAAKLPLMVHENFRFQPWYREIKRQLDSQAIGDRLHSISFRCRTGDGWQPDAYMARQPYFRDMPKFLIFETGVHFIDTFRYLGGEIDGVFASLRTLNPGIVGEDAGTVLFEFENGCRGMWDANRFNETNAEDPRYTFGEALVEGNGGSLRLYNDGRLTVQPLGESERELAYTHERKNFAGDCVFATQQHFVRCLRASVPFETNAADYLKTLAIQEAVYRSAESGLPVRGLANLSEE